LWFWQHGWNLQTFGLYSDIIGLSNIFLFPLKFVSSIYVPM
jgi:hypothetical protein